MPSVLKYGTLMFYGLKMKLWQCLQGFPGSHDPSGL
jgi:hypothetical protein